MKVLYLRLVLAYAVTSGSALAQDTGEGGIEQVSQHIGEMSMQMDVPGRATEARSVPRDTLRFEPLQMLDDLFRDDIVLLMRHGPTDWSKRDAVGVATTDCDNQRIMTEEGRERMRDMGILLAGNGLMPSQIVVSEWCRNQQTLASLLEGMALIEPDAAETMPIETDPGVNLLLSLQGAPDATRLATLVSSWDGHAGRDGPLLIISHYTNIEEMTQFRVFEGETLVLDPDRDNLVLGYVRLRSAAPDVGHFADSLASPLLREDDGLDMVERYYAALNSDDPDRLRTMLAEDWVGYGLGGQGGQIDADGLQALLEDYRAGMTDLHFEAESVYVADDVVTVIGHATGRHTSEMLGIAATGRDVRFQAIAVHRIENDRIAESWITSDRVELLKQIAN